MICSRCKASALPRGWNASTELCWTCETAILSDVGMARAREVFVARLEALMEDDKAILEGLARS